MLDKDPAGWPLSATAVMVTAHCRPRRAASSSAATAASESSSGAPPRKSHRLRSIPGLSSQKAAGGSPLRTPISSLPPGIGGGLS